MSPESHQNARRHLWVLVLGLALATRLWLFLDARDAPFWSAPLVDEQSYLDLADARLHGAPLLHGAHYAAPGYVYFLAVMQALGGGPVVVKLLQLLLGALSATGLYGLAARFLGPRWALLPFVAWLLYPPMLLHELLLLKPSLTVFLVISALLLATARADAVETNLRACVRWGAVGLCLGLAALFRGEMMLVAIVMGLGMLWARRRAWPGAPPRRASLVLLAAVALVLAVPSFENQRGGGGLVLLAYSGGTNFYIGNNPGADGSYLPLRPDHSDASHEETDAVRLASRRAGRTLSAAEVSRFWWGEGLGWWGREPMSALGLTLRKWALLWGPREIPDVLSAELGARWVRLLANPIPWASLLFPLSLVGVFLARREPRYWPLWAFLLGSQVALVPFFVFERFRLPMLLIALPFAGLTLRELASWLRRRSWRPVILVAASLIVLGFGLASVRVVRDAVVLRVNVGSLLLQAERYEEALREFETVKREQPEAWRVEMNIAYTLAQMGRVEGALGSLRTVLERLYEEGRRTNEPALGEIIQCHELAGDLELGRGRRDLARGQYDAALRLMPDNVRLRQKRARLGAIDGRPPGG